MMNQSALYMEVSSHIRIIFCFITRGNFNDGRSVRNSRTHMTSEDNFERLTSIYDTDALEMKLKIATV